MLQWLTHKYREKAEWLASVQRYLAHEPAQEMWNLLHFVVFETGSLDRHMDLMAPAVQLLGRVPTIKARPFYAWKVILSHPWHIFEDLLGDGGCFEDKVHKIEVCTVK